jgi:plasminogen activator
MLELGAELRFLNHSGFEMFALGGYKWDRLSWEARGGSYIYSVGGFRDTRGGIPPGQVAISYTQDFGTPYIGLGAGFAYGPFSVRGSVVASHAARGEGKDTHHLRDLLFEDEFRNGRYIMAEAELAYKFSDRLALVGSYQYQNYDEVRGTTKILHKPTGLVFSGYGPAASGAELETQMFSLAARYALQ